MNDPYNTQAYANAPYAKESWQDLSRRADRMQSGTSQFSKAVLHKGNLHFTDTNSGKFRFKKTDDIVLLQTMRFGQYVTIFRMTEFGFRKLLHELNSFLKGG